MNSSNLWFPVALIPSFGIQWFMLWRLKSQITTDNLEPMVVAAAKTLISIVVILQILMVVLLIVFACTRDMNLNDWIFYGSAIGIGFFSLIGLLGTNKVAPKRVKSSE